MQVNNPNKLPVVPISEFEPSQGELKYLTTDNYNKLKSTIEERGFDIPVYVWLDEDGKKWLLDGHQRQRVLETEGWNEPIPYLTIKAPDKQAAMARLLQITSQYGTITQEGIDNFIDTYALQEAKVYELTHFDGISIYDLGKELQGMEEGGRTPGDALSDTQLRDNMSISLTFDKASYIEFMTYVNYFREYYGVGNSAEAIIKACLPEPSEV